MFLLAGLSSLLTLWMVFSETLKINRYKGIPGLAKTHQKAFISPVDRGKCPNHIPTGKLVTGQIKEMRTTYFNQSNRALQKKEEIQVHGISLLDQGSGHHFIPGPTSGLDLRSPMVNTLLFIKLETIQIIHQNYSGCMLVMT